MQPHVVDLPVDAEQERVGRGLRDQKVKLAVPFGEGVLVVDSASSACVSTTSMSSRFRRVACRTASRVVKGSTASRASISWSGLT